jgi:hypothetical protein
MEEAVAAAGTGDLAEAERLLVAALARCPDHPGVLREVAGLRFRQSRLEDASELAGRLLEVDPADAWGWDLLASIRFLSDDASGALRAWNRVGRPVVQAVRIQGGEASADGVAYREQARRAGIAEGQVLTPEALALGVRRLETLPSVSRARLDYRPVASGGADVEGAVSLRPGRPFARAALPGHVLRGLGGRVALSASTSLDRHDRWAVEALAEGRLREVSGGYAVPAPGGLGAWSWELTHAAGRFTSPDGGPAMRLERTGFRWGHTHWLRASLRTTVTAGLDRWSERGTLAAGGLSLLVHPPDAPAAVGITMEGWSGGSDVRRFGRVAALATILTPLGGSTGTDLELDVRLGADAISVDAPPDLRPRFGAGASATHPMRARSHLDGDGAVRLLVPGNAWIHGGVELRRWGPWIGPLRMGIGVFADAARGRGGPERSAGGAIHLGAGLRARVPGGDGWLRVDWAGDPESRASRVSAAFVGLPWSTPFTGSGG